MAPQRRVALKVISPHLAHDEVGLATLVEQGFFDEDLTDVDQDLADRPEMTSA